MTVTVRRAGDLWLVDIGCDGGLVRFDQADDALDCALVWRDHDALVVTVPSGLGDPAARYLHGEAASSPGRHKTHTGRPVAAWPAT